MQWWVECLAPARKEAPTAVKERGQQAPLPNKAFSRFGSGCLGVLQRRLEAPGSWGGGQHLIKELGHLEQHDAGSPLFSRPQLFHLCNGH